MFDPSAAAKLKRPAAVFCANDDRAFDLVKHLSALRFRELQGRSILDAITERRLDEVKRLLAGTRDKMDVIASACGYRNPTYLKNLFKKQFGMSMRDFRASARGTLK